MSFCSADLCLGPQGRDEPECVVTVPNEFLQRIPPPGEEDLKALEQIAESSITPKCASEPWTWICEPKLMASWMASSVLMTWCSVDPGRRRSVHLPLSQQLSQTVRGRDALWNACMGKWLSMAVWPPKGSSDHVNSFATPLIW